MSPACGTEPDSGSGVRAPRSLVPPGGRQAAGDLSRVEGVSVHIGIPSPAQLVQAPEWPRWPQGESATRERELGAGSHTPPSREGSTKGPISRRRQCFLRRLVIEGHLHRGCGGTLCLKTDMK